MTPCRWIIPRRVGSACWCHSLVYSPMGSQDSPVYSPMGSQDSPVNSSTGLHFTNCEVHAITFTRTIINEMGGGLLERSFPQHFLPLFFILGLIVLSLHFWSPFKGTVQRDFNSVFWHKWIDLCLNMNRFWFINFSESPTIFDLRNSSSHG